MSYRTIVSGLVSDRKKREPSFSFAKLAEATGLQKPYLSRVLKGERDFSADQLHAIAQVFNLSEREQDYLQLLLEYDRTALQWRKKQLHRKICQIQADERHIRKTLNAQTLNPTEDAATLYYLDPLNAVVHHMLSIPRFRLHPDRIAITLGLTPLQFSRIKQNLLLSGMIRESRKGLEILREHFHLNRESALTLPYLVAQRQLSSQQIQRIDKDEKMTFSVTLTTDEKTRKLIHERFLNFLKEIEPAVKESPAEDVYQINFDLFPWSV